MFKTRKKPGPLPKIIHAFLFGSKFWPPGCRKGLGISRKSDFSLYSFLRRWVSNPYLGIPVFYVDLFLIFLKMNFLVIFSKIYLHHYNINMEVVFREHISMHIAESLIAKNLLSWKWRKNILKKMTPKCLDATLWPLLK